MTQKELDEHPRKPNRRELKVEDFASFDIKSDRIVSLEDLGYNKNEKGGVDANVQGRTDQGSRGTYNDRSGGRSTLRSAPGRKNQGNRGDGRLGRDIEIGRADKQAVTEPPQSGSFNAEEPKAKRSQEKIESADRKGLEDFRKRLDSITGEYSHGLSTESKGYLLNALKENDPDYELREYTYPEGYDAESWNKAYDEALEKDMEEAMDVSPEELIFNPHFELPSKNRDAIPARTEKTAKAGTVKELDDSQAGFAIDRLRELANQREDEILEREIYEGSLRDEAVKTSDYNINVKENGARYTDERIDALIRDNAYGDDKSSFYVTSINPKDFLELTLSAETRGKWMANKEAANVRPFDPKDFAKFDKGRVTFDTPYLSVDFKTGQVFGHEGRHRMIALSESGIESVPILVKRASHEDGLVTDVREAMELTGQDFGSGKAVNGARVEVNDLIPACKNFEGDIKSTYGGDAKVK